MTPKEFCNWLEGYLECTHASKPLQCHIDAIYAKLKTVAEPVANQPFVGTQFPSPPVWIPQFQTTEVRPVPPFEITCNDPVTICSN